MPMPDEAYEPPFVIEPLFARKNRVATLDMSIQLALVPYGPDCGFTEHQARSWAALLAQAPAMHAILSEIAAGNWANDFDPMAKARDILALCEPHKAGQPFRRVAPGNRIV